MRDRYIECVCCAVETEEEEEERQRSEAAQHLIAQKLDDSVVLQNTKHGIGQSALHNAQAMHAMHHRKTHGLYTTPQSAITVSGQVHCNQRVKIQRCRGGCVCTSSKVPSGEMQSSRGMEVPCAFLIAAKHTQQTELNLMSSPPPRFPFFARN